jgi:GNAT superfamily N-acetyltransferase
VALDKAYDLIVTNAPEAADRAFLEARIREFNDLTSPHHRASRQGGVQPLGIFARDEQGQVVAGLSAEMYWGWMFVDDLWVHESLRGQGYGSRLLALAEEEARSCGCGRAWLRTYSFQARGFYEKYGYRVVGELADYPPGEAFYWMRKDFAE